MRFRAGSRHGVTGASWTLRVLAPFAKRYPVEVLTVTTAPTAAPSTVTDAPVMSAQTVPLYMVRSKVSVVVDADAVGATVAAATAGERPGGAGQDGSAARTRRVEGGRFGGRGHAGALRRVGGRTVDSSAWPRRSRWLFRSREAARYASTGR